MDLLFVLYMGMRALFLGKREFFLSFFDLGFGRKRKAPRGFILHRGFFCEYIPKDS